MAAACFIAVGYRVGAALRRRTAPGSERSSTGSGGSPAHHIRRAHYHLYWTGPGRQEPRIRWLHPILVGDPRATSCRRRSVASETSRKALSATPVMAEPGAYPKATPGPARPLLG